MGIKESKRKFKFLFIIKLYKRRSINRISNIFWI